MQICRCQPSPPRGANLGEIPQNRTNPRDVSHQIIIQQSSLNPQPAIDFVPTYIMLQVYSSMCRERLSSLTTTISNAGDATRLDYCLLSEIIGLLCMQSKQASILHACVETSAFNIVPPKHCTKCVSYAYTSKAALESIKSIISWLGIRSPNFTEKKNDHPYCTPWTRGVVLALHRHRLQPADG